MSKCGHCSKAYICWHSMTHILAQYDTYIGTVWHIYWHSMTLILITWCNQGDAHFSSVDLLCFRWLFHYGIDSHRIQISFEENFRICKNYNFWMTPYRTAFTCIDTPIFPTGGSKLPSVLLWSCCWTKCARAKKTLFFSWLDCTQSLTWHIFLFQAVSGKDAPLNNFFFYDGVEGSGMVENFKWITKTLSICCCYKKIIIWTGKKVNKTIKSQNCVLASSHDWLHVVEWQVAVCIPRVLQCEGAININYPQHFA